MKPDAGRLEDAMISAPDIRTWVRSHTSQETVELMGTGGVIRFEKERLETTDSRAITILSAAYVYFETERERRSDIAKAAYYKRVKAGVFIPYLYLGYEPYSFVPSIDDEERAVVAETFQEAADGVDCAEIAEWMNDCGYKTIQGNQHTARSIRRLLSNPVYCGDVYFRSAGVILRNHHTPLVTRELWYKVQGRLVSSGVIAAEIAAA